MALYTGNCGLRKKHKRIFFFFFKEKKKKKSRLGLCEAKKKKKKVLFPRFDFFFPERSFLSCLEKTGAKVEFNILIVGEGFSTSERGISIRYHWVIQ